MTKGEKLIAALKVASQNLKTIHRHLVSENWENDHELFGEYYEKIDEFEDSVIEQYLSNKEKDVSIKDAIEEYDLIEINKDYNANESYELIKKWFDELYELFDKVKKEDNLTKDQISLFEEYQNWLKLEKDFKIDRRINGEYKAMKLMGFEE